MIELAKRKMRSAMCVRRYYQAYEKRNLHETQLSCRNATLTFSAKLISYDRRSLQRSPSTTKIRKTVIYDVGCAGLDFRESNARISLKRSRTLYLKKSSSIQLRTSPTKFLMKRGETGGRGGQYTSCTRHLVCWRSAPSPGKDTSE